MGNLLRTNAIRHPTTRTAVAIRVSAIELAVADNVIAIARVRRRRPIGTACIPSCQGGLERTLITACAALVDYAATRPGSQRSLADVAGTSPRDDSSDVGAIHGRIVVRHEFEWNKLVLEDRSLSRISADHHAVGVR